MAETTIPDAASIIPDVVKLIAERTGDAVVGINIVYVSMDHVEGDETHENCKPSKHHIGGCIIKDIRLKRMVAMATAESAEKLFDSCDVAEADDVVGH